MDSLTVELKELLNEPRAATAYGMDLRELRHNLFLDFLLGHLVPSEFSKCLAANMWTIANGGQRKLRPDQITTIVSKCNPGIRGKRPDEIITITTADGKTYILVVEMKVKADSGVAQLRQYLSSIKNCGDKVHGILLRIPGNDLSPTDEFARLDGDMYKSLIEAALKHAALSRFDENSMWLIQDYLKTLQFLSRIDKIVVTRGDELKRIREDSSADEYLQHWLGTNWNWICLRIAREAFNRLPDTLRFEDSGAYVTAANAAIDITPNPPLADKFRAHLYYHWNIGKGFEVRAIVDDYNGARTNESRESMIRLAHETNNLLRKLWSDRKAVHLQSIRKYSCMVGRINNKTFNAAEIANQLTNEIKAVMAAFQNPT